MKKYLRIITLICVVSLLLSAMTTSVFAAEQSKDFEMMNSTPKINAIAAKYSVNLFERVAGNQALKIVPEQGAGVLNMELAGANQSYVGTNYFEFYISVKGNSSEKFEITPGIRTGQGWRGLANAQHLLFTEGEIGKYYIKPDGGQWQLKESGSKIGLNKGFSGIIRIPTSCFIRNSISGEIGEAANLEKVVGISNVYSFINYGDELVLDDFRFINSDNAFLSEIKTETTSSAQTNTSSSQTSTSSKEETTSTSSKEETTSTETPNNSTVSDSSEDEDFNADSFFGTEDNSSNDNNETTGGDVTDTENKSGKSTIIWILICTNIITFGGLTFFIVKDFILPRIKRTK